MNDAFINRAGRKIAAGSILDATYRWMFDVASPRVNRDGSFSGFIGSAIDTTDQILAKQALEKISGQLIEAQEQERSRIARELHDDICQRLALLSMEIEQANPALDGSPEDTKNHLEEIGELLGISAGTVRRYLPRALALLREKAPRALGEELYGQIRKQSS